MATDTFERTGQFWCGVLRYVELERDEARVEIGPPGVGFGGPRPAAVFSQIEGPTAGRVRHHIDVNATDRKHDGELERLLAAGAHRVDVGQTGAQPWQVLADPEGKRVLPTETTGTKGVVDQSPTYQTRPDAGADEIGYGR